MTNPTNVQPKSFSEHLEKRDAITRTDATELNDGKVNIESSASDSEAFATAILQNAAVALTDPYLAPPGNYIVHKYVNRQGELKWKITLHKGKKGDFRYSFWVDPLVHKMFMDETRRLHDVYKNFIDTRKHGEEFAGIWFDIPPWIMKLVEIESGYEFGTEPFFLYCAVIDDLHPFFIDKDELNKYKAKVRSL